MPTRETRTYVPELSEDDLLFAIACVEYLLERVTNLKTDGASAADIFARSFTQKRLESLKAAFQGELPSSVALATGR